MIKTVYEKWEELKDQYKAVPKKYIAKYYIGGKTNANVYFAIENEKLCIYMEFGKNVVADLVVPTVKGMKINIVDEPSINQSYKYLYIKNESQNEVIFEAFSSSLVDELHDSLSYFDSYTIFLKVVKEYKDYFANPNVSLSKQEEQGLCAELKELSNLISVKGEKVVYNWQGPSKNKRDFVFNKSALEIKSTSSQENPSIRISNENQLDSHYPSSMEHLFLKVYIMESCDIGININNCVEDILKKITKISTKNVFLSSLAKLKIIPEIYKAKYNFSIQKEETYEIKDGFPSITTRTISTSIFDVSYRLKIDDLSGFLIKEEEMNDLLQ